MQIIRIPSSFNPFYSVVDVEVVQICLSINLEPDSVSHSLFRLLVLYFKLTKFTALYSTQLYGLVVNSILNPFNLQIY